MISKALPRVEAGNDLNSNSPILSEIWGREVLGMFATMPHESWPNRLFPIAPASTSQTISKVRSSLWRRFLREEPLLLGLVTCHGVRTTDLPREPAGPRSLPAIDRRQTVSYGLPQCGRELHACRCQLVT